ncbi:MAG TPA: AIPR family protein [Ignavibacteria bacterium]
MILDVILRDIKEIYYQQNYSNDDERFIAWYLKKVYLKSDVEAKYAITDGMNDKGIDAVLIDEEKKQIIIIQGKFYNSSIDHEPLQEILSSWVQIQDLQTLQQNCNQKLKNKIDDIHSILQEDEYEVIFELVTTGNLTKSASEDLLAFQNTISEFESPDANIVLVDEPVIIARLDEALNYELPKIKHTFVLECGNYMKMTIANFKTVIAAIKLSDVVKIPGIKDRTLFRKNVRQALPSSTKVNKKIKQTIEGDNPDYFFLYHNGITALCDKLDLDDDTNTLDLTGLNVVNGCQSLTTIYSASLKARESNAYILFKFYEIPQKDIVNNISVNTNSQTAVKSRDLRSNDKRVIALKRTYEETFKDGYFIRQRGEERPADKDENKTVDLVVFSKCVMAWYCQRPNIAYNENKIFDKYFELLFKESYESYDILTLVKWFKLIDNKWNSCCLNLNENLLAIPSYSKFHLLFAIQSCFCAANNQLDKVPFPSATIKLLENPDQVLDVALNSLNSAFDMVIEEYKQKDKIFNLQNWVKSNDSVIKIQTSVGLTMRVIGNIPGGSDLKKSLHVQPEKFFLRLKAD